MLENYYVKPSSLSRIRASGLAPQIESYPISVDSGFSDPAHMTRSVQQMTGIAPGVAGNTWVFARTRVSPGAAAFSLCRVRTEEGLVLAPIP
jgi:hypothetical protein